MGMTSEEELNAFSGKSHIQDDREFETIHNKEITTQGKKFGTRLFYWQNYQV